MAENATLLSLQLTKEEVLTDYQIAWESRQASILGRKEVLTGKAKFGIFGDGKELPQLVMSKVFQKGDWRSGYYRDQTFMNAAGLLSWEGFFALLYGDTDIHSNSSNGGRMMNNHFATRILDENGNWKNTMEVKNVSADISPTAGQMPRLLGLALASKLYKNNKELSSKTDFSINGNEVAFGTIGDASTSEGHFFETINAAGVLKVPLAISVWDDGWGISVAKKYQTTKQSISEILKGFEINEKGEGFYIYKIKGWDYPNLIHAYREGIEKCRKEHIPVLFHIDELTQPQGHSTSGSHERYKSADLLEWEKNNDCLLHFKNWILTNGIAKENELELIEKNAIETIKSAKKAAWSHYLTPILKKREELKELVNISTCKCKKTGKIETLMAELNAIAEPVRKDVVSSAKKILRLICNTCSPEKSLKKNVTLWLNKEIDEDIFRYSSHLYCETERSALRIASVPPLYDNKSPLVTGREVLNLNFDKLFEDNPLLVAFGEDVGLIGGVNQTMEGLQKKYSENRIFDTGIREATIIGQALGLAIRGFRPIAEIQYFDYLLYGLQVISDDLATLRYRTRNGQMAPMIISTRGHRLEGIWHSGSPLSMVINSIRGVYVLVPRNMTQAAGFYNTMLASDDPALIIEPLNAYRLREKLPLNIGNFRIPLGVPEIIAEGTDITIVTYGSCVRIAQDALTQLKEFGISAELIDVQTLLPFDLNHSILESLKKTNKIMFFDEDVPGGATAFMMHQVLEIQNGFDFLDAAPKTLTGKAHRAAYGTDGDYFSNPNAEDVFDAVYKMMHEYNPNQFPSIY